jgi:hypothetical protein
MYTQQQISEKMSHKALFYSERVFLMAHTFTHIILQKGREESSEAEYFEGLIFSSYLAGGKFPVENEEKRRVLIQEMAFGLYKYVDEVPELNMNQDNNTAQFVLKRYNLIRGEISKFVRDDKYLTPFLIYNLYINPLNKENLSENEIIKKVDFDVLLRLNKEFKIKFGQLYGALNLSIRQAENAGLCNSK